MTVWYKNSKARRYRHRSFGEINDTIYSVFKQAKEAPLGLACNSVDIFKFYPFGLKTNPAKYTLGKSVVFAHGKDGVHHLAFHKAEIPGTVNYICIGNFVDELIELPCENDRIGGSPFLVTRLVATLS